MPEILNTPDFQSEQEEAEWWDSPDGRAAILQGFKDAEKNGTLRVGTLKRRGQTPATSIRLDSGDIALARQQAEKRGLRYQTYLKMILHQALEREASLQS